MPTPNPQLAIVIPTYRWNELARDALTQAASIGSEEIIVHIGDNSVNAEKQAFLRELAEKSINVVVSCHTTNIGADKNWIYLIKAQSTPYICMAADDDYYGSAYFRAGLALVRDDPDCATASGLHVALAHTPSNEGPIIYSPSERKEATPLDRIRRYNGQNSICYAISPRQVIFDFANYVEVNPLQCPFNDYMLAFHLLSMGTYRMDPKGYAYIYDNTNWHLNDSFIESNARWYIGYGLSKDFAYLTRLHWAVVAVHFFSSTFRAKDLAEDKADAIASYLFQRQRREFVRDFHRYRPEIMAIFKNHALAVTALTRLMTSKYDRITTIFDDFAVIVSVFSPEIAFQYRRFQSETLQSEAGPITVTAIQSGFIQKTSKYIYNLLRAEKEY